ncbi:EamA family transporter [Comamonas sp. GB3 AK4-5]|uniref:EamA family transporter n=1 Tax=Comamonas sp. GB3 AK4-5 TaxID=3231487 RepID=UPI00351F1B62
MFLGSTAAPALALFFNALVWGVSWWPLRQLQAMGLHPLWATAFIYLLAAVLIGCWRPGALRQVVGTSSLWWILLASGMGNAAFNWAVGVGDVVRVVLLFYLMPLWSLALAWLLLKERVTAGAVVRALLAVLGAALVLAGPAALAGATAAPPAVADILAVLSGFAFALNTVLLRRGAALPSEGRSLAMFLGGASVAGAAAALLSAGTFSVMGKVAWPLVSVQWMLPVGALAMLFWASNRCLQYGAARLSARVTAVVMSCEVVFASVSAVWWGDAVLNVGLVVGGCLVVSAALAGVLSQRG